VTRSQAAGLVLVGAVLAASGCNTDRAVPLTPGRWGGVNVELVVTGADASATFKCGAIGHLTGPVQVDSTGSFTASGTYESKLVQGGPKPAVYSGRINGTHMSLVMQIAQDPAPQQFDLTLDQPASFEPCNF
jgi:hypothetical protein